MLPPDLATSLVNGGFLVVGGLIAFGSVFLNSLIDHRRRRQVEAEELDEREKVVLHGAFALTNFLNERLNHWDVTKNVYALTRLTVAQPYLARLIERAPANSDRLMVTLVGLGLRLEVVLFAVGEAIGFGEDGKGFSYSEIELLVAELSNEIELLQILVTGELPFMTDENLEALGGQTSPQNLDSEKSS